MIKLVDQTSLDPSLWIEDSGQTSRYQAWLPKHRMNVRCRHRTSKTTLKLVVSAWSSSSSPQDASGNSQAVSAKILRSRSVAESKAPRGVYSHLPAFQDQFTNISVRSEWRSQGLKTWLFSRTSGALAFSFSRAILKAETELLWDSAAQRLCLFSRRVAAGNWDSPATHTVALNMQLWTKVASLKFWDFPFIVCFPKSRRKNFVHMSLWLISKMLCPLPY